MVNHSLLYTTSKWRRLDERDKTYIQTSPLGSSNAQTTQEPLLWTTVKMFHSHDYLWDCFRVQRHGVIMLKRLTTRNGTIIPSVSRSIIRKIWKSSLSASNPLQEKFPSVRTEFVQINRNTLNPKPWVFPRRKPERVLLTNSPRPSSRCSKQACFEDLVSIFLWVVSRKDCRPPVVQSSPV